MKSRLLALAPILLFAACRYYPARDPSDDPPITCGNGKIDPGEVCDGDDLNGQTCETQPVPGHAGQTFYSGTLACNVDCLSFNTDGCSGYCGDGLIESDPPSGPEVCDGTNLGGHNCTMFDGQDGQPYDGGTLACASNCKSFVTTGCNGNCGDGTVDPSLGEECDGNASITETCQSLGFYEGEVTCTAHCTVDTSDCSGYCGDGDCETNFGENCSTCPTDCGCGIFGNCGPDGVCICVTRPFTFVDCNNDCDVSETVGVNCQICGDPACDVISPVADGVTWHYYPQPPTQYVQCGLSGTDTAGECIALSGTMYFPDGCEPFFTLQHLDGCVSDLEECTQTFIDQLQADGLWPAGRARFGASDIHTVDLDENLVCEGP